MKNSDVTSPHPRARRVLADWLHLLDSHPRIEFPKCSVETYAFNLRVRKILAGNPAFDITESFSITAATNAVATRLGIPKEEAQSMYNAEVAAWLLRYEIESNPLLTEAEQYGVKRYLDTFAYSDEWTERFLLLYAHPSLDEWFAAGIYDVAAIAKFEAQGVDVELARMTLAGG